MAGNNYTKQAESFLINHHRVVKELEKGLKRPDGSPDFFYRYSMMLEEDLKVSFIEPLIQTMGYSSYLESDKYFRREWKDKKGKPVDYLLVDGNKKCILETKSPQKCISNNCIKELAQLMSYMIHYNINRGCLTDGLGWVFIDFEKKQMRELRLCDSDKSTISVKRLENVFYEIENLSITPENTNLEILKNFEAEEIDIPNGERKQVFLSYPGKTCTCTAELGPNKIYNCTRTYRMDEYYRIIVHYENSIIQVKRRLDTQHLPSLDLNYIVTKNWYAEWKSNYSDYGGDINITGFIAMAYLLRLLSNSEEIIELHYMYPDIDKHIPHEWTPITKTGSLPLIPLAVPEEILQADPHWHGYICLYG